MTKSAIESGRLETFDAAPDRFHQEEGRSGGRAGRPDGDALYAFARLLRESFGESPPLPFDPLFLAARCATKSPIPESERAALHTGLEDLRVAVCV